MEKEIYAMIADIGGTKTRLQLALFHNPKENPLVVKTQYYATQDYKSFDDIVEDFLQEFEGTEKWPKISTLACAGAIFNNETSLDNVEWTINADAIAKKFKIGKVNLINDFTAKGYSILKIPKEEIIILQEPTKPEAETLLVLGPGTGLGMAILQSYPDQNGEVGYIARGTEGAHASFAAVTGLEKEFCDYYLREVPGYKEEFGYMQCEKVYCGPSLPWIYKFFCMKEGVNAEDLSPEEITERGWKNTDPICRKVIEFWAGVYGNQAADFALTVMPYGGIYLVGNMTEYLSDYLGDRNGPFMKRYLSKDPQNNEKLKQFPIYIIKKKGLGLYGAAVKAQRDYFGLH